MNGDPGLIYSNRCYNCALMAPDESHVIDIRDNDDTCAARSCRSDRYSGVSHLPAVQFGGFMVPPSCLSAAHIYSTATFKNRSVFSAPLPFKSRFFIVNILHHNHGDVLSL